MPKHDAFSPKAIANMIKAKGLQKLKWYCEMCKKQCRDENGFKCHKMSESHQRQMKLFAANPGRYMGDFSRQFEKGFIDIFSRQGGRRVKANDVYQEYIKDRQHIHMNATMWTTLTQFVYYLGKKGIAIVDENESDGRLYITYINRDPDYIRKQEKLKEMHNEEDKQRKYEENRIRRLLLKQQQNGLNGNDNNSSNNEYKASKLERSETSNEKIKFAFETKTMTLKELIDENETGQTNNDSNNNDNSKNDKIKNDKIEKEALLEEKYNAIQAISDMNGMNGKLTTKSKKGKKRGLSEIQRLMIENEQKKQILQQNSSDMMDNLPEREKKRRRLNTKTNSNDSNEYSHLSRETMNKIEKLRENCLLMPNIIVKIIKGEFKNEKAKIIGFNLKENKEKKKEYLMIELELLSHTKHKNNNNNRINQIIYEKESHLETVIPKFGHKVKILKFGKYRGKIGVLQNIETSKYRGIVQITKDNGDTKELKINYENFSKLSVDNT